SCLRVFVAASGSVDPAWTVLVPVVSGFWPDSPSGRSDRSDAIGLRQTLVCCGRFFARSEKISTCRRLAGTCVLNRNGARVVTRRFPRIRAALLRNPTVLRLAHSLLLIAGVGATPGWTPSTG